MQELDKISEEIDVKITGSMGRKREGLLEAHDILRKYLSSENNNDIVKPSQVAEINISKEEFDMIKSHESVTFRCGNETVSLSMCKEKVIGEEKKDRDNWIPVEDRLPINHEGPVEVTVGAGYRTVGYYDQYREEWWTLDEDSILDVIAWKEPSEPYRPERSEGE